MSLITDTQRNREENPARTLPRFRYADANKTDIALTDPNSPVTLAPQAGSVPQFEMTDVIPQVTGADPFAVPEPIDVSGIDQGLDSVLQGILPVRAL